MVRCRLHVVMVPVVVYDDTFRTPGLAAHLARRGHQITILGWNERDGGVRMVEREGGALRAYLLPGLNLRLPGLVHKFPLLFNINQILRRLDFDILDLHRHADPSTLPPALLSSRMGKPIVMTLHGLECKVSPLIDMAYWAYVRSFDGLVIRRASRIIVLTKHDARLTLRLGCPPRKVRVIPNGVNTRLFRPLRDGDPFLVVWHGRLVRGKGLEHLIRAIHILRKHHGLPMRLLLVGEGPIKERLASLAQRLGLDSSVEFTGWRPSGELPELICRGTIYAFPSFFEGMPWAVLEAMACGRAVVASNIPGIKDIIDDGINGLLVRPGDVRGLAQAIAKLVQDEELRKLLSENARAKAVREHDWAVIAEKVERIYLEAIEKPANLAEGAYRR